ncbi:hypothetical protein OESDEN_15671 [Oesophagostomum dentatum]|uniref:Trehalase n=1 Tax=Oesophagostomum dentatum TaxID=61180 RepID=A0A0B1SH17_OESDE|nr:hypothetical protein OESDEN_15671 [Oesophagostomum dentatum]
MKSIGVFDYPGGIPTSMITDSEEQWDFPNGFSPLNHMVVEGLRKSHNAQMQDAVRAKFLYSFYFFRFFFRTFPIILRILHPML